MQVRHNVFEQDIKTQDVIFSEKWGTINVEQFCKQNKEFWNLYSMNAPNWSNVCHSKNTFEIFCLYL